MKRNATPSRMLALFVALGALAGTQTAVAQSSVMVLGIRSIEGDDEFARNLTGALRHAASQVNGWTVSDREVTLSQMVLAHGCADTDVECMNQIATSLDSDRVLYGEVTRTASSGQYDFSMTLRLFNRGQNDIERSVSRTIPGVHTDIDDLREPVRRFIAELSGSPRVGTLTVAVNVPGAEVFVDDTSAGQANGDGRLVVHDVASGTRRVRIVAPGHQNFSTSVSVEAYAEASVEAELMAGGGGGGGGVPVGAVIGGALVGVGLVSAGLWIWSMTVVDGVNQSPQYQEAANPGGPVFTPVGENVCDYHAGSNADELAGLPALCSDGRLHEVLQFVFLGVAAVSTGVGLFLLIDALSGGGDEDSAQARDFDLHPSFGAGYGYLGASGRF